MADILIRGMDKPKSCFQCDLSHLRGERLFCHVTKDEVLRSKIASDCPIQELPEHGDLIDRDALCDGLVSNHPVVIYASNEPVVITSNKEETK